MGYPGNLANKVIDDRPSRQYYCQGPRGGDSRIFPTMLDYGQWSMLMHGFASLWYSFISHRTIGIRTEGFCESRSIGVRAYT